MGRGGGAGEHSLSSSHDSLVSARHAYAPGRPAARSGTGIRTPGAAARSPSRPERGRRHRAAGSGQRGARGVSARWACSARVRSGTRARVIGPAAARAGPHHPDQHAWRGGDLHHGLGPRLGDGGTRSWQPLRLELELCGSLRESPLANNEQRAFANWTDVELPAAAGTRASWPASGSGCPANGQGFAGSSGPCRPACTEALRLVWGRSGQHTKRPSLAFRQLATPKTCALRPRRAPATRIRQRQRKCRRCRPPRRRRGKTPASAAGTRP